MTFIIVLLIILKGSRMCEYDQTSDKNNPITFRKFGSMDYGIRYQGMFTCSFQFYLCMFLCLFLDCAFSARPKSHIQFNEKTTEYLGWLN